jgi:outer membrane lipoprotein-sorting protein
MNSNALCNPVTAGGLLSMLTREGVESNGAALEQTEKGKSQTASAPWRSRRHQRSGRLERWQKTCIAICLGLAWLSAGQASQAAEDPKAKEAVDHVAALFSSKATTATVDMQITKPDGKRTIPMQFWSLGQWDILVRVLNPSEDAGSAILKVGYKTWYYLPKAKRTVEMPISMMMTSWMGGHFTLDDLVDQGNLTKNYDVTTSFTGDRDGATVSEYTLTPKPNAPVVWGKILLEVRQSDQMPIWQHYYDENGKLVRELTFSDYKTVGGRLIPTQLVMRPLDQTGEQTMITYKDVVFDAALDENMFAMGKLKQ